MRFITRSLWLVLLLLVLPGTNSADALVGDTETAFGLDGSFRMIGGFSHNYSEPLLFERDTDNYTQSILRLTGAGHPASRITYEAHLVDGLNHSTARTTNSGSGFGNQGTKLRYRAFDTSWDFIDEEEDTSGELWLDRLNLKITPAAGRLHHRPSGHHLRQGLFLEPTGPVSPF